MTRATVTRAACVFLSLLAGNLVAAEPNSDLRRLFPKEAPVTIEAPQNGLAQLALSPEVLAACKPDLADLRLLDAAGQQVPFVVRRGNATRTPQLTSSFVGRVLRADRHIAERAGLEPLVTETYDVTAPAAAPESGAWELVLDTDAAVFTRTVDVSDASGKASAALAHDVSVFRLAKNGTDQLVVRLPKTLPSKLRVTIHGDGNFYLEPRFRFASGRTLGSGPDLTLPLSELSRERAGDKTVVVLERHGGVIPTALRLETSTTVFDREVVVSSVGPGAKSTETTRARLFRIAGETPSEEVDVPLGPTSGDKLRVEIDDGDSPTLAGARFYAVVEQPSLVFAAASLPATLYFGGGRAHLPRYDISGLSLPPGLAQLGNRGSAIANLYDRAAIPEATLGPLGDNPAIEATPALGSMMRAGATVDDRLYSHERVLAVAPSRDGLTRISLSPEDLAVARDDLADVRVVDSDEKQWPYLVDPDVQAAKVPLRVSAPQQKNRDSSYRIDLPGGPLAFERVGLETSETYFDRAYRLMGVDPDDRSVELTAGRLTRGTPAGTDDGSLTLHFARTRLKALELLVEDGSNTPLALRVHALVPLPALYLVAPLGSYRLLLGNPGDTAPLYDIERARDLVLAVGSDAAQAGELLKNPTFRAPARLATAEGSRTAFLWGALVLAIVTLGFLTLRMARREGAPPG